MIGTGMSAMFVMALNYITELIGDNKVRTGLKLSHTRSANYDTFDVRRDIRWAKDHGLFHLNYPQINVVGKYD